MMLKKIFRVDKMINTQQKYLLTNNLVSEVIDNKQLRKREFFDIVMSKLLQYHKVKKKYIVDLVENKLSSEDKQLLLATKTNRKYHSKILMRINKLLSESDKIVYGDNNNLTLIDNSYNRELRDLTNTLNNFRKYLFLAEFEKEKKRLHKCIVKQKPKIEIDYEFEKEKMNMFDKSRNRYFDLSHDTNNNRKNRFYTIKNRVTECIIDPEIDYYNSITLARIHDKYLNKYRRLIRKKRSKLFTTKKVKQIKTIDINEMISVIKSLSGSS